MKKLLLIGIKNESTQSLHDYLHKFFMTQLCFENSTNIPSMIRVVEPDIVVIILEEIAKVDMSFWDVLKREYFNIPVLTIGTPTEYNDFIASYGGIQAFNMSSSSAKEVILHEIYNRIDASKKSTASDTDENKVERHVLVVDDNAMTLRGIKTMLEQKYRITLANSGPKAMVSIGKDRPDVILLDYEMPVCDGKQTFEMIKADDDIKDIPVIFLTGVNDREHIQAVLKMKPAGYLLKPVSQEKLINTIETAFI